MALASTFSSILTMHDCTHSCLHLSGCPYTERPCIWRPENNLGCHSQQECSPLLCPPPFSWGLSLARSSLVWLNCLVIEPQQSAHLCFLSAEIRGSPSQAWLFMWVLGSNSGPCAYEANMLLTNLSPSHLLYFSFGLCVYV